MYKYFDIFVYLKEGTEKGKVFAILMQKIALYNAIIMQKKMYVYLKSCDRPKYVYFLNLVDQVFIQSLKCVKVTANTF